MTTLDGSMLSIIDVPTCCGSSPLQIAPLSASVDPTTKFHFALNVSDLERSVAFYTVLFGVVPAKHYPDYAKFELLQPPLVFSLVPNPPSSGGSLSYFGFPVESTDDVKAAAERLSDAGLEISCQEGTVCGFARQDKVWVSDPDRNFWEIYVVHEDIDPEVIRSSFDGIAPPPSVAAAAPKQHQPAIWEHRVLMPIPDRIPFDDDSVDEVRLEGTFNDKFTSAERLKFLVEIRRVLRPSGRLNVHGLVADGPLSETPQLPGVAALVQRVPQQQEPLAEIAQAGFESVRITKLPVNSIFRSGDVGMREIKIEARKPAAPKKNVEHVVVYKGPFSAAVDDSGQTFHRGRRTPVSQGVLDQLAAGAAATQFLFLTEACESTCGCG